MELATKAMEFASRAASNNTVVNVFLGGAFAGLTLRSLNQQRQIEALESQRDSLVKSNKSMRQTIWDWKQKLYADAEADKIPIVPLSKLKSIYGEAPTVPQPVGTTENKEGKASATKIMI
ncbi:hypothetical protein R6Q59_029297 [Mikania micrantha]|uniref:Uncharacterized protein n=1 Tax=Mikania micrantha TaxID=192012 RepID=A0A5N6LVW1_9ASTR|nr:hypothetical protein E3N88_39047 [Mikania micrantha]